MPYSRLYPSAQLKPYVEFYYIWEHDGYLQHPVEVSSPPNYCSVMVFNYSDPYQLYNYKYKGAYLPKTFISGQSLYRFKLKLKGRVGMLGVVFKGAAYRDLINLPNPLEYANDRIELELLIGKKANSLNEKIAESPTNNEKIKVVEDFLIQLIRAQEPIAKSVDKAVEIILDTHGLIRVDQLAEHLCMCPRNFRRRFIQRVGVSPKFLIRVKRFNFMNLALLRNPNLSWRTFISDGGYYDQSHLIKDYTEFAGVNPSQWLKKEENSELKLMPAEN